MVPLKTLLVFVFVLPSVISHKEGKQWLLINSSTQVECSEVLNLNSSLQCGFVRTVPACLEVQEGFIPYLELPYCLLPKGIAFIILVLWIMFLFLTIGIVVNNYFCPCLTIITKALNLSENAAGVTFLALGNGLPDIIGSTIAILNSKRDPNEFDLGIEALLGSGMFVSSFVIGIIAVISHKFTVEKKPFIRDISFCIVGSSWVIACVLKHSFSLFDLTGMLVLSILYILIVIINCIVQNWKEKQIKEKKKIEDIEDALTESQAMVNMSGENAPLLQNGIQEVETYYQERPLAKLCHGLIPLTINEWHHAKLHEKILMLVKAPALFAVNLTMPLTDENKSTQCWNKWLHVIQCITGPVFVVMATKIGTILIADCIPVWVLTLSVGAILGLIVAIVTRNDQPPKFYKLFAALAFTVSVVWMSELTNEIIGLLELFGIAFKLSDAILGLTFLSWGVSLGEFVSSVVLAKQGLPNMGASGCFGGSSLNTLFGLAVPITIIDAQQGHFKIPITSNQSLISAGFLCVSLISSAIGIPLMGFKVHRLYGVYLIVIYIAYLVVSCLGEINYI